MGDTQQKIDYKFDERLRKVEQTLASQLATYTESTKHAKESMDTLTGQVKLVETSVNKFKTEMKEEVSKAQGMAIGGKQVVIFFVGLVTVISLIFGIIQFLGDK